MTFLWFGIGIILPAFTGWLLVRLCEGRHLVLFAPERWALGFLLGLTGTMFVTFLAHIAGLILFTRLGFLSVQVTFALLLILARFLQWKFSPRPTPYAPPHTSSSVRPWLTFLLILLTVWTIAKIALGTFILVSTPPYFDDTLKNWNYRAKVFTLTHRLDIGTTPEENGSLSGYPPTVPLSKAWLATLSGQWNEGLMNSIHIVWFLVALILLYCALRHRASMPWALLGTYLLASLPLYLFDGLNAYADVFLSAHLLAAVTLTTRGLTETDARRRGSLLRLAALATGLLVITKNEALVLYLPLLIAILIGGLAFLHRRNRMSRREIQHILAWTAGWLFAIGAPWILFKWTHGLTFGNAKSLSGSYSFGWQPGVPYVLWVNTFFEGNWHLLFPLLLLLLVIGHKHLLRSIMAPLALFVLAATLLQTGLFLFTSLSAEALRQTGLARGFVQLAPLAVLLTTLLMRDTLRKE
ncbi:MAG: glycosyltransferase family 39 protein [Candidatus Peribacteraceae bacterium]|nr:glycosyltransferase family 39 protein [Candidatus Peribacteraceae bacterium]MDD5741940.1 glycosyltransferase family 39 protein [Candidatus Peribacteraceae bacterium]